MKKESKTHKVTVWSTSNCPWCHKTKEWLDEHNIKYKDVNVEEDTKAAEEMIEKSGQRGVPVIDIDGKIIVGFDPETMKKYLGIKD